MSHSRVGSDFNTIDQLLKCIKDALNLRDGGVNIGEQRHRWGDDPKEPVFVEKLLFEYDFDKWFEGRTKHIPAYLGNIRVFMIQRLEDVSGVSVCECVCECVIVCVRVCAFIGTRGCLPQARSGVPQLRTQALRGPSGWCA